MNREIGLLNQTDDGFEPALIRNSERCIDAQAKLGQAHDVGYIQVFKLFIVWDVEKDGLDTLATCPCRAYRLPPTLEEVRERLASS